MKDYQKEAVCVVNRYVAKHAMSVRSRSALVKGVVRCATSTNSSSGLVEAMQLA